MFALFRACVYVHTVAEMVYYPQDDIKKTACASHTSPALVSARHCQSLLSRSSAFLRSGGRLFFLLFLVVPIQPVCVSGRTPTIAPRPHAVQVRPFVTHREALQHQQLLVHPCLLDAPPRVDLGEDSWQLKDLLRTDSDEVVLSPPLQQAILHGHQRRQAQLLSYQHTVDTWACSSQRTSSHDISAISDVRPKAARTMAGTKHDKAA